MKSNRITKLIKIFLLLLTFLSACNLKPSQTELPLFTQTATSEPTITPVVETEPVQGRVILLTKQGGDTSQIYDVQEFLSVLAAQEGLLLVTTDTLSNDPWDDSIKVVVALETDTDLMGLASTNPSVQFLALNMPMVVRSNNLSTLNISLDALQKQAFLAGYLAAITTDDYRVGVLVSSGDEIGEGVANAFFIGAQYFCGLCNSRFGPIEYYPKMAVISEPLQQQSWQAAADLLIARSVQTVYIQSEVVSSDLLAYLSVNGVAIIAPNTTTDFQKLDNWLGTLQLDPLAGIETFWSQLLNGQGGLEGDYSVRLIESNPDMLSEGRLDFFMKVYEDVINGFINTAGAD